MDGCMDNEAGSIHGSVCPANTLSVFVDMNHVGHLQEAEMDSVRIEPKCVWLGRVCSKVSLLVVQYRLYKPTSKADMATPSISEAQPRKYAKGTCHLLQLPSSCSFGGVELWNLMKSTFGLTRRE